jgi:tetratricopeptide (TPR) repeat protein
VLAAIDQFEVLFTAFPARHEEREGFLRELREALDQVPALKLLLVISDEQLAPLSSCERQLSRYPFSYVRINALSTQGAIEAVEGPVAATSLTYAPGSAGELVDRLRTIVYQDFSGQTAMIMSQVVEPLLLQIVCTELWSSLPAGIESITVDDLHAFGDVNRAVASFYDVAVRQVQVETGQPEGTLRAWIESSFITEHGTRGTACRGSMMTAGMANAVVDALERRLVLATEYRAQSIWYQLAQDGMIIPVREANRAWRARRGLDVVSRPAPATPGALQAAAETALAEGDFASAHRFAQRAVDAYRELGDNRRLAYALVLQGDIARIGGDLASAEENLQAALSTFASIDDSNLTARALSALADVHFSGGDYQRAAEFQREAIDRRPTDVQALVGLGYALWYGGSPADAEVTFAQALTWDAESASALGGRGQVRAEMREYDDALADLDIALILGLAPVDEIDAQSARALALAGLGRGEDASTALAAARIQDPDRPRTLRRAARIAALRDDRTLAMGEVERALAATTPPLPPWDASDARRLLAALRAASVD